MNEVPALCTLHESGPEFLGAVTRFPYGTCHFWGLRLRWGSTSLFNRTYGLLTQLDVSRTRCWNFLGPKLYRLYGTLHGIMPGTYLGRNCEDLQCSMRVET